MLSDDGIDKEKIDEIIYFPYRKYKSKDELVFFSPKLFNNEDYIEILNDLSNGYTLEEIIGPPVEKIKTLLFSKNRECYKIVENNKINKYKK